MPEATFDYDLATGKSTLLQQGQPMLLPSVQKRGAPSTTDEWLDLSSLYVCKQVMAASSDGVHVPLTVVHSSNLLKEGTAPALLLGYGAYGQMLETEWCSDRLSLLDRGWVLAFAHVRWVSERTVSGSHLFPASRSLLCSSSLLYFLKVF
jgi:protease II